MAANMNEWLNSLAALEAMALCSQMRGVVGVTTAIQVSGGTVPTNLGCLSTNLPRTGNWYMEWATCEVINLRSPATGHPRWQPTIINKRGDTPANPTALGRVIKSHITDPKWQALKGLANSNGQVKIPCHHLAFKSSNAGVSIPANMGQGASMSHLCDTSGCIRSGHLQLAQQHVENLERQRCHGVTLIVGADMIVHEIPCGHCSGDNMTDRIATSCRKIRMVWLPDSSINALIDNYQRILEALSTTPTSSQL
jgi:Zinc-binding loop region of homing endonuclease